MKKFKLETPCMIKNLKDHKNIRDTLISLIKDTKADYIWFRFAKRKNKKIRCRWVDW